MESLIVTLLIAALIFALAWWGIGLLPLPAGPEGKPAFPLRTILYVLLIVVAIVFLLQFI